MNFQDIIKPFSLTPAVKTGDSPFDKGAKVLSSTVQRLYTNIQAPVYIINDAGYFRRLMFQFNYSFNSDFYITNAAQLANLGSVLLNTGCICIKWRVGSVVHRYKILDYRFDFDWSTFTSYTNQLVKKNFCLEFWRDSVPRSFPYIVSSIACGITRSFSLKTDQLAIPTTVDSSDFVYPIGLPPQTLATLCQPIPLVFPIDWSNQAFLNNV